jgi:hypothetical protein
MSFKLFSFFGSGASSSGGGSLASNPVGSLNVSGKAVGTIGCASTSPASLSSGQGFSNYGKSFVEMVNGSDYKPVIHTSSSYEVRIINPESAHWLILVKMKGSGFPYLTFEITTSNGSDLLETTRAVSDESSEEVGDYDGDLYGLCQIADEVVKEMAEYNFFTSNCQQFCNNLLQKMGLPTYPPTIGPETHSKEDIEKIDNVGVVLNQLIGGASSLFGHLSSSK